MAINAHAYVYVYVYVHSSCDNAHFENNVIVANAIKLARDMVLTFVQESPTDLRPAFRMDEHSETMERF